MNALSKYESVSDGSQNAREAEKKILVETNPDGGVTKGPL